MQKVDAVLFDCGLVGVNVCLESGQDCGLSAHVNLVGE